MLGNLRCSSDVPGGVSTMSTSRSPQLTFSTNCLIMEFFLGPRHMTCGAGKRWLRGVGRSSAVRDVYRFFGVREKKPDGHNNKARTHCALDGQPARGALEYLPPLKPGHHRNAASCYRRRLKDKDAQARAQRVRFQGLATATRVYLGPQRSTSRRPTFSPLLARLKASCTDTVLLPTPPFPDKTRTQCLKGITIDDNILARQRAEL